jgi:hypothetical protein
MVLAAALPCLADEATRTLWSVVSFGDGDFFHRPSDIEVDNARSLVYVVDAGSSRVLVFDFEGRFLRAVGRKGQGPGEFATPTGMALTGDGGFAVADRDNNRIQLIGPDGTFIRSVAVKETRVAGLLVIDGRFYTVPAHGASAYSVTMGSEAASQPLVTVLDKEGAKVLEIAVADFPEKQPFIRAIKHRVCLALSPGGRLYLPFYSMNLVHVFDTDGTKKGGFSRPLAFKPITPALIDQRSPQEGVVQMRAENDIVSFDAAFGPDGKLYILTATDSLSERVKKPADRRGPALVRIDVIDPESYRTERTIACDAGASAFGVLGGGRLVYVYEDAEGELALKCVKF